MPALRTNSIPAKTERTHEENQERAYIAASRRSDRSLEARVESARRASEIHKKRTGRALKVTEEDVLNEEMYEEEDDEMPRMFSGVPQFLKTSDEAYNRRLHAYLSHTMMMRNAVLNPRQFSSGNPAYAPQMGMMQPPQNAQMYHQRHQPYPTPSPTAQMGMYARTASASAATGQTNPSPPIQSEQARRHSTIPSPPDTKESVKQEKASPQVPAMQSNFSNAQTSPAMKYTQTPQPPAMRAPYSLSQEVFSGADKSNYRQIFTSELPQNVQMMGFPANGSDFSNTSLALSYNIPSSSSNDTPKSMQQSYSGRNALEQTLPYMEDQINFSRQLSFQQQNENQKQVPEEPLLDEFDPSIFTSYDDYIGDDFLTRLSSGGQENLDTASSVNYGS